LAIIILVLTIKAKFFSVNRWKRHLSYVLNETKSISHLFLICVTFWGFKLSNNILKYSTSKSFFSICIIKSKLSEKQVDILKISLRKSKERERGKKHLFVRWGKSRIESSKIFGSDPKWNIVISKNLRSSFFCCCLIEKYLHDCSK